jgi:hypothetical protein
MLELVLVNAKMGMLLELLLLLALPCMYHGSTSARRRRLIVCHVYETVRYVCDISWRSCLEVRRASVRGSQRLIETGNFEALGKARDVAATSLQIRASLFPRMWLCHIVMG